MDVTALCSRLRESSELLSLCCRQFDFKQLCWSVSPLMAVLVLLAAPADCTYSAHRADAGFPRLSPDRLQFFEYEAVSISCEDLSSSTEWRVMKKLSNLTSDWDSSAASCSICPAFQRHSGQYWCEDEEGETGGVLNITVTAGSVILELPTRPVMEGHNVRLCCKKKDSLSKHITDFYKDGVHLGTWYGRDMIIQNVSRSDEGLYKCRISGAGDSAESRLTVFNMSEVTSEEVPPSEEAPPPSHQSPDLLHLLWTGGGALLFALLLLIVGLLLCRKHRVLVCFSSRNPKTPGSVSADDSADHVTYAAVQGFRRKREADVFRASRKSRLADESVIYSSVSCR